MICSRCLRQSLKGASSSRKFFSTGPLRRQSGPERPAISTGPATTSKSRQPSGAPSATSTSAAQPFSTPLSDAPPGIQPAAGRAPPPPEPSVPAGMPLKGLTWLKNRPDPIAMEDHEYPEWLWECLDSNKTASRDSAAASEADIAALYSNSKRSRQAASRRLRKQAALKSKEAEPPLPVHEQTVDLKWSADAKDTQAAKEASTAREEVTRSMREKRKKDIKEGNFLRGMN